MISGRARQEYNRMNRVCFKNKLGDALLNASGALPAGDILFVDGTNGADGANEGLTWDEAFKTISYAISKASTNDAIVVAPGTYDEGAAITINVEGLKIIGSDSSRNQYRTLIYGNEANALFIVKEDNIEISNLGFAHAGASITVQIGDANSQNWYKLHIHDCKFDGWATALNAIDYYHTTVDAPDIHVERCLFRSYADDVIISDYTRSLVNDNIIYVAANKSAISHVTDGSDRGDAIFYKNRIIGVNSGDTGLEIVNTPDAAKLIAYENYIFNCATSITQKAENVAVQMNYVNDAAGGALIDPIA